MVFKFLVLKATLNFMPVFRDIIVLCIVGRAGMAAINDPDNKLNLIALASGLARSLPTYARPLFVRVLDKIDMTGEKCYACTCSNLLLGLMQLQELTN